MKSNKSILLLQLFTLLPAILFLFLYGSTSIPVIAIALFLLGLTGYSFMQYTQKKTLSPKSVIFTLIGSFLLYGFSHLGSLNTPQTFENMKATDSVVHLKLTKPSAIDEVCYYVGIDYDSFSLEAHQNHSWKQFYH